MYRSLNQRIFHVIMVIVIIFVILCVAGILILRYQVEGESNMPFKITKISIIESIEGLETQGVTDKWNLNVNQNNDIYVYIEKNSGYGKTEIIDTIEIQNIKIEKLNEKGETKLYKPVQDEKRMFINSQENEINEITYKGELESNIKALQISNQGGIVAFRYAINNLAQYISQENIEIDHSKLLQLTGVQIDDLKTTLTFDIKMKLVSGKIFVATVVQELPVEEIIEKGTVGIEITEVEDIIFKRVEN